ncbi:MAG: prolyl oligopeptidase family serine peptidase [Thermomicrobiales bacterium]
MRVVRRPDYKFDGRGFLGDVRQQLFVATVASGERCQLTRETLDHNAPDWSPDGRQIAVRRGIAGNMMRTQIALIAADSGATTLIGEPMSGQNSAWSPTGEQIAFVGSNEDGSQPDFYLYTVASGSVRRLTDDLAFLPGSASATAAPLVWLDDRDLLCHGVRAGGSGLYHVNTGTGQTEPLVTWQALHGGLSVSADRRVAVQEYGSPTAVGELAVVDLATGDAQVITNFNTATLTEHPPARWEQITCGAATSTSTPGSSSRPTSTPPDATWSSSISTAGRTASTATASTPRSKRWRRTATSSSPRTRAAPVPTGASFAAAVVGDNGGEDYRDPMAVLDTVLERPYADRDRSGIWGYSYGGYDRLDPRPDRPLQGCRLRCPPLRQRLGLRLGRRRTPHRRLPDGRHVLGAARNATLTAPPRPARTPSAPQP